MLLTHISARWNHLDILVRANRLMFKSIAHHSTLISWLIHCSAVIPFRICYTASSLDCLFNMTTSTWLCKWIIVKENFHCRSTSSLLSCKMWEDVKDYVFISKYCQIRLLNEKVSWFRHIVNNISQRLKFLSIVRI